MKAPAIYTLEAARQDIQQLGQRFDDSQRQNVGLIEQIEQLQRDELRALRMCQMLKCRLDVVEMGLLMLLNPEGQTLLSHRVLTAIRQEKRVMQ